MSNHHKSWFLRLLSSTSCGEYVRTMNSYKEKQTLVAAPCHGMETNLQYHWEVIPDGDFIKLRHRYYRHCIQFQWVNDFHGRRLTFIFKWRQGCAFKLSVESVHGDVRVPTAQFWPLFIWALNSILLISFWIIYKYNK